MGEGGRGIESSRILDRTILSCQIPPPPQPPDFFLPFLSLSRSLSLSQSLLLPLCNFTFLSCLSLDPFFLQYQLPLSLSLSLSVLTPPTLAATLPAPLSRALCNFTFDEVNSTGLWFNLNNNPLALPPRPALLPVPAVNTAALPHFLEELRRVFAERAAAFAS